jgi:hypothetical protein
MRFDEQVIYPYPVLRQGTYDYKNSEFYDHTVYKPTEGEAPLSIVAGYHLTNPALQALVDEGKAAIRLHVHCRWSLLHKLIDIAPTGTTVALDPFQVHGKVVLRTVLHAVEDIQGFSSPDFTDDFAGMSFDIPAGSILGFCQPRLLYVERAAFGTTDSIVEIQQSDSCEDEIWELDTEGERLSILVSKKMMAEIESMRQRSTDLPILMASLYSSAIQQAVELLKTDAREDRLWQRVMRQRCSLDNIDLERLESSKIAQLLLRAPLVSLFNSRKDFSDDD